MGKRCTRKSKVWSPKLKKYVRRCTNFAGGGLFGRAGGGDMLDSILGPAVGGIAAGGTAVGMRSFMSYGKLFDWAPLIGAGAGMAASVPLAFLRGWPTAISGMLTALVQGGTLWLNDYAYERAMAKVNVDFVALKDDLKAEAESIAAEETEGWHDQGIILPEAAEQGVIVPEEQGVAGYLEQEENEVPVEIMDSMNLGSFGHTGIGG